MSSLSKIFVYVPNAKVSSFKNGAGKTDAYKGKISFLGGTGEIMTNGEIFAFNRDADIQALQTLLGTNSSTLSTDLGFSAESIVDAIKFVYDHSNDSADELSGRLDVIEGTGEGSIKKAVNDAVTDLLDGAPDALNTLKEIADWISNDNGQDAANLVSRMNDIEAQVAENEKVASVALIDLQQQINDMTGGAGSIQTQITNNINTLDGEVTIAGSTVAQPSNVDIETSVDVLGSITVSEVDGILRQDQSSGIVLKADAAGAAKKAYDTLMGTNSDTIDAYTMKGLRARVDWKTRIGSLAVDNTYVNTLTYDTSTGELATVENIANTINSIQMWETFE